MSDYGDENPLYFDYYGFQPELYKLKFKSRGDSAVSQRVVDLFKEVSRALVLIFCANVHTHLIRLAYPHGSPLHPNRVESMVCSDVRLAWITESSFHSD